jgi:glycosyltransferase involved in cell wall biosynthesis
LRFLIIIDEFIIANQVSKSKDVLLKPQISVVMATLNEEKCVKKCIDKVKQKLAEMQLEGEIIVADNSNDHTPEIAKAAGAKVVIPDKLGYGNAFIFAIENASGRYIVMGDADGTYDFNDLPKFVYPLIKGEVDFILGSRYSGKIMQGAMPWLHRYIGNPLITWSLNTVLRTKVSDAHCGIRSFSKSAWEKLHHDLMAKDFCSEMLIQIKRNNYAIKEVPVNYYVRFGKPKAGTFLHGYRCFKFLLWRLFFNR